MDNAKKTRRFGCSPGCQVSLLVIVVGLAIAGYFGFQPIRATKQLEQDLLDRYATVPEYVPAPDGAIAPERMEIFLDVRRTLLEQTGHIQKTYADIDEAESQEELTTGEGLGMLRNVMNALPHMVEFFAVRNSELLESGMGLGEYFYIFAVAYGQRMCGDCEHISDRTSRELAAILRNQADLTATGRDPELADALTAEIADLESGLVSLPWQRGLPASVAASLQPYRDRLDPLYCEATRELELKQKNKSRGGLRD